MSLATIVILFAVIIMYAGIRQTRSWLLERVRGLEERIDRLAVGGRTERVDDHQADEIQRLEERVDFLERLLEERPKPRGRSLPGGGSG